MEQKQALEILKSGANVFLTGEPGSGKTYTINRYVEYLRTHGISPAITASTGIAATHIGGMTIHSWSGLGIKDRLTRGELKKIATSNYVKKRIKPAKVLIIDEISMLAPNTLSLVESICREVKSVNLPFGGMQVVLVGDFFQLPPVTRKNYEVDDQGELFGEISSKFAYDAACWRESDFTICYITEQYRQEDMDLTGILSNIRKNSFDDISLDLIREREIGISSISKISSNTPKLYSHNIDVDSVNDAMLEKISGRKHHFAMKAHGHPSLILAMKKGCLSPEDLYLKVGASVMFTKNNTKEGFVNGTLGIVSDFDTESGLPIVEIRDGCKIKVEQMDWVVEEDGSEKGCVTQLPLRLAWAITVHKSQGISLDEAVMDLSKVFEYGQGYVALSRVKRLSGIYLLGWNEKAFQVDSEVLARDKEFHKESLSAENIYSNLSKKELESLQHDFILACDGAITPIKVEIKGMKKKVSTYEETLDLWQKGMSVSEIARERVLNENTILSHIDELMKKKLISRDELNRIISPALMGDLKEIQKVFRDQKTDKLTPVFKFFEGKYSYDDLRLARMTMQS